MTQGSGASGGSGETAAKIVGTIAAAALATAALAVAAFARVDVSATVAWATVDGFFVVLAVGLVRRWILAGLLALVLGGAGLILGLLGLLAVGDQVYDRVKETADLTFRLIGVVLAGMLLGAGVAGLPPLGRVGRRVLAVVAAAGLGLAGVGVAWLLEVQSPPNPTPGAANATWDCGSAYSPGSTSTFPSSGCADALDTARTGGRIALAVGLTLAVVAVAVLAGQVGWRRTWPIACLFAGVVAAGVVVWFVALPLDGGRCGSVYDGSEGVACGSMAGGIRRLATMVAVASPVLFLAGLVGVGAAGLRSGRSARGHPP